MSFFLETNNGEHSGFGAYFDDQENYQLFRYRQNQNPKVS